MRGLLDAPRALAAVLLVLMAATTLAGCRGSRAFTNATVTGTVARQTIPVPPGQAVLVAIHLFVGRGGQADASNIVLFTSDGTPVCQVPFGAHCAMALSPGRHRVYVAWTRGFVDVWDLEVVEGRTYFATMTAPAGGWGSFRNEKLTPESPSWDSLALLMGGPEVGLDPNQTETLRLELGDYTQLVRAGDSRMAHYDERHLEAHTIRPDDGVVLP